MSFSYDPTRLDIPRNQLRLLLGNEGTSLKTFQDEELEYISTYQGYITRLTLI